MIINKIRGYIHCELFCFKACFSGYNWSILQLQLGHWQNDLNFYSECPATLSDVDGR